ncbi:hypothetical protein IGB42_03990 [Andreprevotia sp. IGB-42]|uniref:hypothetical protein n=1 Tax=Andreprevotia sp. IGB-42 TaxID=2497473 RepID=UPI001357F344|nr:hypothetical protein [Andreprevotia sp. IGB-42]KAF0811533.1 hypothetical protein IGB42_03990 [Andreprevotia sp. IGB-42]
MRKLLVLLGFLLGLCMALARADFTANGWYWNAAEGGTGFMFEAQGSKGFAGFFLYDESGQPVWYVASGSIAGSGSSYTFSGDLLQYHGGQAVTAVNYAAPTSTLIGQVRIDFSAGGKATAFLPARTWQATRYDFAGLGVPATATQPEVGWYWKPAEGGRGYAIEVQNNRVFLAMFHYRNDGSPTWNIVQGELGNGAVTANFETYINGQTLGGPYKSPLQVIDGNQFSLLFSDPCIGTLRYNDMPEISVQRFAFGDLAEGAECRARGNAAWARIPGTYRGSYTGADVGSFLVSVDKQGRLTGTVTSNTAGNDFPASGQISPAGAVKLSAPTQGFAQDSIFTATGNTTVTCAISGGWHFVGAQGSGSFTGQKDGACQ